MRRFLFLLIFLLGGGALHAEYFKIIDYTVNVRFTEEGHADFEEVIVVEFFEPRHGIFRVIPLVSIVNDSRVKRIVKNIEVPDFKFDTEHEWENLRLRIGDADVYVEGRQTYRIRYRVLNPLNFFEAHSEFYWDLLGTQWEVPVEQFRFSVEFPARIALKESDALVYTGLKGMQGKDATLQVDAHTVSGQTTRSFSMEEGLTLAVRLPGDAYQPLSTWENLRQQHGLLLAPILFLIGGFLAVFMARNRKQPIMTEYFPPEGISPAVAGGFVDHSVDTHDVLCLIPFLADKGYLRIETEDVEGWFAKDKLWFVKIKEAGNELMPFEQQFFDALFSYGDRVELQDLKDKFYVHIGAVRAAVKNWIQEQGWYEADQKTLGCLTGLAGLGALAWGAYAVFGKMNLDGIALIVTGVVLFILTSRFNKRTPTGNSTYQRLEGFRQFVKKAEKPVIERLLQEDPHYYDKTLPFALAFGYLSRWNKQFEGLLSEPPQWYGSRSGMHHMGSSNWTSFTDSFSSEIDRIDSVFTSSPSSSGSGSGGGGSSGGGSGGGGGGSW